MLGKLFQFHRSNKPPETGKAKGRITMAPSRKKHPSTMSKKPNGDRRQRSNDRYSHSGKASVDVPFETRLKGLYKELSRSYLFYEGFRKEFENEIRGISIYADEQILEDLWFMKVRGRSALGRRGSTETQEDADEDDFKPERDGMLFKAMERRIFEALAAVWCSSVSDATSTQSAERLDAIVSMHGKMRSAEKQIAWLLAAASESSGDCERLLIGLTKFKELIDPKSEKNKVLYGDAWEGDARQATVVDAGN